MTVITNYAPLNGSPITTPADFIRAWIPTTGNPTGNAAACGTTETANDMLYLTQGKFNLNNTIALSSSNPFGAVAHLSTLSTVWNTIDTQVGAAFDNLVTYTNMAGQFTVTDPTKFDTIQAGITTIKNNLIAIKSSVDSLRTSVTATRDGLAVNVPTTATYNVAKANYDMTINSLYTMSLRLQQGINNVTNDFPSIVNSLKSTTNDYLDPDLAQDIPTYMSKIFVKYDTGKPYNSSDCGDLANPCATLKEAMDNVINSTDTISNTIVLLGSVVGGTTFLGNLYGLCTKLVIKSQNLTNIVKIDGINATEPFFFFSEPDGSSEGTNHCGTFAINLNSLNFENWNTLIKFNITHNTPESPDIQSPIIINIVSCNVTSSKSIVYIQPRNFVPHKLYNGDTITIRFSSSIVTGLLPSDLLVPGSLVDYLPPFYVVGGSISFLSKTIITNNEVSTPLVFLQNGDFLFGVGQIINLNRFSSGHPVFVLGNATVSFLGIFQENELSSFLFFDNCSFSGSSLSFPNNTITSFTGFGNKFLGNTYANSFMVFKNMDCIYPFSINLNQPQEGSFDGSMFYFENNHITLSENIYTPLFEISSFIESVNSNVIILSKIPITVTHPIIGRDSSIIFQDWIVPSLDNETFCGCSNCNYFSNGLDTGVISIDTTEKYSSCNEKPTPTPSSSTSSSSSSQQSSSSETPTPTTTDVSSTPPPSSSQLTSSSESSMSPFKKKVIIITSVVLGSASITLVSIFSVLYRIRKNKEYLLNSMTSNPSSEDGDVAAAADNDVSPNLESTIDMMDHDDEDCAQLEKL